MQFCAYWSASRTGAHRKIIVGGAVRRLVYLNRREIDAVWWTARRTAFLMGPKREQMIQVGGPDVAHSFRASPRGGPAFFSLKLKFRIDSNEYSL